MMSSALVVQTNGSGLSFQSSVQVRLVSASCWVDPKLVLVSLSLDAGHRITIDPPDTICDGVRAQTPGSQTFPIVQSLVDEVITVADDEVIEAMYLLWREGLVIEPSGALSVAGARRLGLDRGAVCVLSGGNVTPEVHAELIAPLVESEL